MKKKIIIFPKWNLYYIFKESLFNQGRVQTHLVRISQTLLNFIWFWKVYWKVSVSILFANCAAAIRRSIIFPDSCWAKTAIIYGIITPSKEYLKNAERRDFSTCSNAISQEYPELFSRLQEANAKKISNFHNISSNTTSDNWVLQWKNGRGLVDAFLKLLQNLPGLVESPFIYHKLFEYE